MHTAGMLEPFLHISWSDLVALRTGGSRPEQLDCADSPGRDRGSPSHKHFSVQGSKISPHVLKNANKSIEVTQNPGRLWINPYEGAPGI